MGLEGLGVDLEHGFLFHGGRVEETRLVVVGEIGPVEIPAAASFAGVEQAAAIGAEGHRSLLFRRGGDAPGRLVIARGDEELAPGDECDLLAVGRQVELGDLTGDVNELDLVVVAVVGHDDLDLRARVGARRTNPDLAVVGVAEVAVCRGAEESNGVVLVSGDQLRVRRVGEIHPPDVEGPVPLGEEEEGLLARRPDRLTVVGAELGQSGVLPARGVIQPDVASERRVVMLPGELFVALFVGVDHPSSGTVIDREERRGAQDLSRHSALDGNLVEFGLSPCRELDAGRGVEPRRTEEHVLAVRREARRQVVGGVHRQPRGSAAGGVHHEDIVVAVSIRGEGDLRRVGRPHGHGVVCRMNRQRCGLATLRGHPVDVTVIAEDDGLAIGREGRVAHPESGIGRRSRTRENQKNKHTNTGQGT